MSNEKDRKCVSAIGCCFTAMHLSILLQDNAVFLHPIYSPDLASFPKKETDAEEVLPQHTPIKSKMESQAIQDDFIKRTSNMLLR